jgi:hypothetical protein
MSAELTEKVVNDLAAKLVADKRPRWNFFLGPLGGPVYRPTIFPRSSRQPILALNNRLKTLIQIDNK